MEKFFSYWQQLLHIPWGRLVTMISLFKSMRPPSKSEKTKTYIYEEVEFFYFFSNETNNTLITC